MILRGRAPETLTKLAENIDAAVIVAGSRGLTGFSHFLLGSTTDRLIRKSDCPVLVTRD